MVREQRFQVDDEEIAAVIHEPAEEPKGTIVFAHGFGSDKDGSYVERAEVAADHGYTAVRFDFRGNNESSRSFEEADLTSRIADLRCVIGNVPSDPVYVYASSFGGLVTIQALLEGEDNIDAIVLRAPVTYMAILDDIREEIQNNGRYEQLPGKWVDERFLEDIGLYDTAGNEGQITVPTLIIHGGEDDVVPVRFSEEFYKVLDTEKELRIIGGEGHRFSDAADERSLSWAIEWFDDH